MNLAERQIWLDGKQLADVSGKKCGLITVTVLEDEYIFQLNCLFCPNVLSCFDNFANHIKIKHSPILLENLKKGTDNEYESDRELPDELVSDSVSVSVSYQYFEKEIKVESENEQASNVSISRELQENQSDDDAEFMSEDGEHSTETLSSVGPSKIVSKLSKGSPLNTKDVFEKLSTPILTSSRCQPVEESHHVNLSKDSTFHHPKNEIKLEYEETSNINNNQEHLCNEFQENQSNDEAEFLSEDEHSGESSHETSPKDSKMHKIWRVGEPKNRELALDIIKMWKSYPCLWDQKYNTKKKRDKTWDTIRHSLKQKWNFEIPKTVLSRKIRFLRKQYEQALRNRRKAATSKDVKVPWFFEELSFLEARTYYCKECDMLFRSADSFNHHKYAHDGIPRYFCNVCNKEFSAARLLRQHNKNYHKTSRVSLIMERLCNELQDNHVNEDAKLISEDGEHSMETLSSVDSCKIDEFYVYKLSEGCSLNAKENLEKIVPPNQSNDDAGFMTEDGEHSTETLFSVGPSKIVSKLSKGSPLNTIGDPKNRELVLDIIKMWKSYPCLWDQKYNTKKKRDKTWDTIRHSLKQKWNFEIPKTILSRKICFLRKQYQQALRNRRKAAKSKDVKVPWFFEELSFLETRTYYCKECDILFRSGDSFNHHKYTHDGITRYFCNVCNKEFSAALLLRQHNKNYHKTSSVSLSRERLCNELKDNHVNEDAKHISEDCEHSMETLSSVDSCKIDEFYVYKLSEGCSLNAKENLEKIVPPNQSNDDAEFMTEDGEHSTETLFSVGPSKIVSKLSKGSPLNAKEVIEKLSTPILSSSQYQPIEELHHYPKNEIKLEHEVTSNVNLNQENLCKKLQGNQSNGDAEFLSEDEHSVCDFRESSDVTSEVYTDRRMGNPKNYYLTLDIIKMWKNHPCLWNNKRDNRTKKKHDETWDKIVQLLKQKWNCDVPKDAFIRKIRKMRMQYYEAVRNSRKATTSKNVPVPWFFEELSFLTPQSSYNCEECDEVFHSEDSFKYHQYKHDGIARFNCEVCNKEFTSFRSLKRHKVMHLDVSGRPHECKICGQKFPIKAQLKVHMRRHTKENCLT